jgi:serine/threonine protein kinase
MSMLSTQVIRGVEDIGPYQILEDLGPVPLGTLYLAVDTRTDRRELLKVIPPSRPGALQEAAPWEILLAETQALFRIYHRGIPTLFELAEHEGSLVVALAPVEGVTLHELLAGGRRPDRGLLVDWGCQLLDILAEAHAEGIMHRHVCEDQILVAPEGHLILTGFGLTQLFFEPLLPLPSEHELTESSTPQSDLYAVGLLLRRLAFASGLKGGTGAGSSGRDPLLKVLARATFSDPTARFQDAAEMAEALRQAGRTGAPAMTPVPVTPSLAARAPLAIVPTAIATLPARPERPAEADDDDREDRRFALFLVAAALLVLLGVIATGWLLIGRGSLAPPSANPAPAQTSSALPARPPGN